MGRTNQGGSVLSFIIVGVVAAALLVGGVYVVRNYQSVSAEIAGGPAAPGDSEATPSDDKATKPTDESSGKDDSKSNDDQKADDKAATGESATDTPAADKKSNDSSDSSASDSSKSTDSDNKATSNSQQSSDQSETLPGGDKAATNDDDDVAALPQTGPAESLTGATAVGLFVVASLAYFRSCRALGTL